MYSLILFSYNSLYMIIPTNIPSEQSIQSTFIAGILSVNIKPVYSALTKPKSQFPQRYPAMIIISKLPICRTQHQLFSTHRLPRDALVIKIRGSRTDRMWSAAAAES